MPGLASRHHTGAAGRVGRTRGRDARRVRWKQIDRGRAGPEDTGSSDVANENKITMLACYNDTRHRPQAQPVLWPLLTVAALHRLPVRRTPLHLLLQLPLCLLQLQRCPRRFCIMLGHTLGLLLLLLPCCPLPSCPLLHPLLVSLLRKAAGRQHTSLCCTYIQDCQIATLQLPAMLSGVQSKPNQALVQGKQDMSRAAGRRLAR